MRDADRLQLLLDEELHVVAGDAATDRLRHLVRDLLVGAAPVGALGNEVEERGKLHHLSVRAARDERRLLEAGVLVAPDQLDARREPRRRRVHRHDGRDAAGRGAVDRDRLLAGRFLLAALEHHRRGFAAPVGGLAVAPGGGVGCGQHARDRCVAVAVLRQQHGGLLLLAFLRRHRLPKKRSPQRNGGEAASERRPSSVSSCDVRSSAR
jgi:hypothetical protein